MKYHLQVKRRAWHINARPRGADELGDDAGAKGRQLNIGVNYLNVELGSFGDLKVASMAANRSEQERKEIEELFKDYFAFRGNLLSTACNEHFPS